MELIFKLPENKPPFVGVLFPTLIESLSENRSLADVSTAYGVSLNVCLTAVGAEAQIKINGQEAHLYRGLIVDMDYIRKNYRKFEAANLLNFGHVYWNGDGHAVTILPMQGRPFVVRLCSLRFNFIRRA